MAMLWVLFGVLSLVIYLAGGRLTYFGDVLGEKWNLERSFVGLILLSSVTSLPELCTSLAAVLLVDSPDLAMGNVLGSNLFNVFILPILALLYRNRYLHEADARHSTTGSVVLFLYGVVGLGLVLEILAKPVSVLGMSLVSPVVLLVYLFGLYSIFAGKQIPEPEKSLEDAEVYEHLGRRMALVVFLLSAFLVVGAGVGLSVVGKRLATMTGLGETFFGSLFFAFVTSLPELVVSWVALKELRAVNLAVGNVMGSCLFNLGIVFAFDLASYPKPLFRLLDPAQLLGVFGGILMVSLASYTILIRQKEEGRQFFSLEMAVLVVLYVGSLYMLYAFGRLPT